METEPGRELVNLCVVLKVPLVPTEKLPALNPATAAEGRIGGLGFGVTTMVGGGTNVVGGAGLA